ncbi:antA/AntB antirepressor family protein [Segetibacter koreensis]
MNLLNRVDGRGGKKRTNYILSMDCAKHIAMVEDSEKGMQVRDY